MTLLLEYLAKNEDASMSVGQWAPQKIVNALAARNCVIYNLCTLASLGWSVPREYAVILHSTFCFDVASSVFRATCVGK